MLRFCEHSLTFLHLSLIAWVQEKTPILDGASDDPVPVDFAPSPFFAAALGHLLLPPPPPQPLSMKKVITQTGTQSSDATLPSAAKGRDPGLSPRIVPCRADASNRADASKLHVHQSPQSATALPSPRLKRLNLGDFANVMAGKTCIPANGRNYAATSQEAVRTADASSLRPEELPTTPKSPSDHAAASSTAAANSLPSISSIADTNVLSSDIKTQLMSGFISSLSPPITCHRHDFSSLPVPSFPTPRGSAWSLPPPSLRRFSRRVDDGAVEHVALQRLTSSPRQGDGQILVVSDDNDDDRIIRGAAGIRLEVVPSDVFHLQLGPISFEQQQQQQTTHRPIIKPTHQSDSPRLKRHVQKPIKGPAIAAASSTTAETAAHLPPLSAIPILLNPAAHLFQPTFNLTHSRDGAAVLAAPPPSAERPKPTAKNSPRRGCDLPWQFSQPPLESPKLPPSAEDEFGKFATFTKLVKLEQM